MSDLQKRNDDALAERDEGGVSKLVYWIVAGAAFLVIGLLVVLLGPWLLIGVGIVFAFWLAGRIFKWWTTDDEPTEQELITHEPSADQELGSEIALEDLRQRSEQDKQN